MNDLLSNPPLEYDFTASWNTSRKREFWRLMFKGLSPREFRVVHAGPFIASAFKDAADLAVITTAVELPTNNQRAEADDEGESMSSTSDEARSEEDTPEPTVFCSYCHHLGSLFAAGTHPRALKCCWCDHGIHFHHKQVPAPPGFEDVGLTWCTTQCCKDWARSKLKRLEDYLQQPSAEERQLSERGVKKLATLPKYLLEELCVRFQVPVGTSHEMACALGGIQIPLEEDALTQPLAPSSSVPSQRASAAARPSEPQSSEPSKAPAEVAEWCEADVLAELNSMTPKRLKDFVQARGVEPKAKKQDLAIQALLLSMPEEIRVSLEKEYAEFLGQKGCCPSQRKPVCNQLYASTFNSVDTFDRRFYELFRSKQHKNWQTTALIGYVLYLFLNIQALSAEFYERDDMSCFWLRNDCAKLFLKGFLKIIKLHTAPPNARFGRPKKK